MKNKHGWYGLISLVIATGIVGAQTYPTIRSAKVQAQVIYDTAQQMYYYNYSVFSDTTNTGNIIGFHIDIARNPNSVDFDTTGLIFEDDFVLLGFREEYSFFMDRIVPVGFSHSPGIWYGDFSNYLTAHFSGAAQLIHPGGSLSGFTMMSKGLPCIRSCIVLPDFDVVALFPNPEEDTTITEALIDSVREAVKYRGFTIGPASPDSIFNGLIFLDTIKNYISQSRSLGWIADTTTRNKYTVLMDSARHQMERFYSDGARPVFSTVLQDVVSDSAQVLLSSEAYALIRFNTEYLRDHLPRSFTLSLPIVGSGTITKSLDNPTYDTTAIVQLTATPSSGYTFSGWSGDVTDTAHTITVTMNNNKNITATFTQIVFSITASAGPNGGITPNGNVSVNYGRDTTFTISPNPCYHIDSVIVNGIFRGTMSSYTFTNVQGDSTIRALFKLNTDTITASAGSNGTISPSGNVIVNCGSSPRFCATPNSCYHLDSLIVDGVKVDSANCYTFSDVTANHAIRAVFAITTYTLTTHAVDSGSVTKYPNQSSYNCGTTVPVKATANLGYKFTGWSGDTTGTTDSIAIPMYKNWNVTANFVIDHYLTVPAMFSTIQSAVNFSRHGDTVAVSTGSYSEIVNISGKDSLKILNVGAVDQATVQGFTATSSANYILIKGFIVDAAGTNKDAMYFKSMSEISFSGITIEACLIRNSSLNGISLSSSSYGVRIVNNRIHNNSKNGITLPLGSLETYLVNNTIVKNGYNGVWSGFNNTVYLVNNIISYNGTASGTNGGRYGIWQDTSTSPPIEGPIRPKTPVGQPCPSCIKLVNNLITGNNGTIVSQLPKSSKDLRNYTRILDATDSGNWTTAGNEGTGIAGATTTTFANVFVSTTDLHLKSGSFAINRGVNSWSPPDATAGAIPSVDFEGTSRPQGGTVDMGADEY